MWSQSYCPHHFKRPSKSFPNPFTCLLSTLFFSLLSGLLIPKSCDITSLLHKTRPSIAVVKQSKTYSHVPPLLPCPSHIKEGPLENPTRVVHWWQFFSSERGTVGRICCCFPNWNHWGKISATKHNQPTGWTLCSQACLRTSHWLLPDTLYWLIPSMLSTSFFLTQQSEKGTINYQGHLHYQF